MQSTGQNSMQTPQPVHPSSWMYAIGMSFFFFLGSSAIAIKAMGLVCRQGRVLSGGRKIDLRCYNVQIESEILDLFTHLAQPRSAAECTCRSMSRGFVRTLRCVSSPLARKGTPRTS